MIVVANAGPLIALARIGCLDLLQTLYGQLRIPPAVWEEVLASGSGQPEAVTIGALPWIHVVEVHNVTAVQLMRDRLDAGESEAIVLALELNADLLLIDEARGRRVAEARGLNKTGTLGTLVMAKRRGLVPLVTPLLDQLRGVGFYVSGELHQTVRALDLPAILGGAPVVTQPLGIIRPLLPPLAAISIRPFHFAPLAVQYR